MSDGPLGRFAEETEPSMEQLRALRARLDARPVRAQTGSAPLLTGVVLGALGAVLLLLLLSGLPSPSGALLDRELDAEAVPLHLEPVTGLSLDVEGRGRLGGTERAPRVDWQSGVLRVAADGRALRRFTVRTGEALVTVRGTRFVVDRDPLGTHVEVSSGEVSVVCGNADERFLGPGGSLLCKPTSAAGMLARARALQGLDAPVGPVLDAASAGLGMTGLQPDVAIELKIVRIETLRSGDRVLEALEEARLLAEDAAYRTDEVTSLVEELERELIEGR
jgi:ferric-dicitrate binding protein FerR (iron transport regulator)